MPALAISGTTAVLEGDFVEGLSVDVERAVLILTSILLGLAILILAAAMWKRMRVASLVVRPFIDGAVGVKIGPGIASLVEERLMGALRRESHEENTYDLDRVAIDIELLAEDNDLSKAITQLVDVPQLKLVGALMGLVERMLPSRGLAVTGELLPAGSEGIGVGVALALYKGSRLEARSSLWESEVKLWLPGAVPTEEEKSKAVPALGPGDDPSPHYGLAAAAAWWVQYEAAQAFDRNVSLVTKSAPSFSLVGVALAQERKAELEEAADSYAKALVLDPDNVAALFNLALLLARLHELHAPAALLLVRAEKALESRHGSQKRSSPQSELKDPTWYRVRYALAVQCLQLAGRGEDWKNGKKAKGWKAGWDAAIGWPRGLVPGSGKSGRWKGDFGPALEGLLVSLAEDASALPPEAPAELATRRAGELLVTTGKVLKEDGWRWVGQRRPRRRRWTEPLRRGLGGHVPRRWRKRPIASDERLTQFLSEVIEPAAAVLYCATIVQKKDEYERFRAAILEPDPAAATRLDRRQLSHENEREWSRDYLSMLLAKPRAADGSSTPFAAYLRKKRMERHGVRVSLDPRANYSFACMLSRLASAAPKKKDSARFAAAAGLQLEAAILQSPGGRGARLAKWALADPDLDGLRKHDRPAFDLIVASWGPAERRPFQRVPVDSSKFSSAAYQNEGEIFELRLSDGSSSQFFDVPERVVKEFEDHHDPEQFVTEEVEPNFPAIRARAPAREL